MARFDGPHDRYARNIWFAPADGGPPAPFTSDDVSTGARWSPDGRTLAMLRTVNGVSQIALVDVATRATRFVTSLPAGATTPVWSHDGKHVAFVGITRDERPPARIDFTAAGFTPAASQRASDVRTIGVERYESNGVGYTYDTLPAGLTFVGRSFSEALLIKLAYAYEQATHHRHPPPQFPALP